MQAALSSLEMSGMEAKPSLSSSEGSPINTRAKALSEYIAEIMIPVAANAQIAAEKFHSEARIVSSPQKLANSGSPKLASVAARKNNYNNRNFKIY